MDDSDEERGQFPAEQFSGRHCSPASEERDDGDQNKGIPEKEQDGGEEAEEALASNHFAGLTSLEG